jgi:hypothetical protein
LQSFFEKDCTLEIKKVKIFEVKAEEKAKRKLERKKSKKLKHRLKQVNNLNFSNSQKDSWQFATC